MTLAGCSLTKENAADVSDQPESEYSLFAADAPADNEKLENATVPETSEQKVEKEDNIVIKIMREGEMDEMPATLFAGEGYSIYLTDGDWQQHAPDAWTGVFDGQIVLNGQVQLWIVHYEDKTADQVKEELESDGYTSEYPDMTRQEGVRMERMGELDVSETRILIIEDEKPIADLLKYDLCREGFAVKCAYTGAQGMLMMEEFEPQLVLLDWMLPDFSGVDLLKLMMDQYDIPVIVLTARGAIEDKVYGMSCGADDYITKPFDLREVNIRIRAVLRRFQKTLGLEKREQIRIPDGLIYEKERTVLGDGEQVELTPKEFDLLLWMARHPRQVFTRERLLDAVWGYDYTGDTRTVDMHIQRLRKKLRAGEAIITVYGVGYKYVPEET